MEVRSFIFQLVEDKGRMDEKASIERERERDGERERERDGERERESCFHMLLLIAEFYGDREFHADMTVLWP